MASLPKRGLVTQGPIDLTQRERFTGTGYGEYEWGGEESRESARLAFLYAVDRHEPCVLDELSADLTDLYSRAVSQYGGYLPLWSIECEEYERAQSDSDFCAFFLELSDWCARWHLDTRWCRERAMEALRLPLMYTRVTGNPTTSQRASWHVLIMPMREIPFDDHPFVFEFRDWNPMAWTEGEYLRALRAAFEEHIRRYVDRRHAIAREVGLVRRPMRFTEANFDWLAMFQVVGCNYSEIAREYDVTRQAVMKQVKALSAFIDLPLRGE